MITKEVIDGKLKSIEVIIEIVSRSVHCEDIDKDSILNYIEYLNRLRQCSKSIQDIQKESFNAAREMVLRPDFDLDEHEPCEMHIHKFKTFEDYFKTLKTE